MPHRPPPSVDRDRRTPPPAAAPLADAPASLAPDVVDVVRRAAALPNALAVLERAPLECAAVLLGARPVDVERARAALESPLARAAVADALVRLARAAPEPAAPTAPHGARTADELVRSAERSPAGLRVLATASPECAAVLFSVRPALVLEARALLAARGVACDGGEAT